MVKEILSTLTLVKRDSIINTVAKFTALGRIHPVSMGVEPS